MHKHHFAKPSTLTLFISGIMSVGLFSNANSASLPATMQQAAGTIQQRLSASQLTVDQGIFRFFTINDCAVAVEILGNCQGNNPTSPYGMIFSPLRPDEVATPLALAFAQKLNVGSLNKHPLSASWRMAPGRDAIIMIGVTPPKHTYISYINYLNTRENLNLFPVNSNTSSLLKMIFNVADPSTPTRRVVTASLNNGLSMKTLKSSAPDNASGATIIIMTPDKAFEDELRARIAAVITPMGFSPDIINALPYPADRLTLGLDAKADDFMMLARAALPDPNQQQLADDYYRFDAASNNTTRMTVFRVFDNNNRTTTRPNLYAPMPERKQGWNEDYLKEARGTLLEGVKNYFQQAQRLTAVTSLNSTNTLQGIDGFSPGIPLIPFQGQLCIGESPRLAGSYGCLGDNPHTTYVASLNAFNVDGSTPASKNVVVTVGINHTMATGVNGDKYGKSMYTSMSAYHSAELKGLVSSTNLDFSGSARMFADWVPVPPVWQPLQRKLALDRIARLKQVQNQLYVTAFARNCDAQFGTGSLKSAGIVCKTLDDSKDNSKLSINMPVRFFERAYMRPDGLIGPDYSELAMPMFIQFKQ